MPHGRYMSPMCQVFYMHIPYHTYKLPYVYNFKKLHICNYASFHFEKLKKKTKKKKGWKKPSFFLCKLFFSFSLVFNHFNGLSVFYLLDHRNFSLLLYVIRGNSLYYWIILWSHYYYYYCTANSFLLFYFFSHWFMYIFNGKYL